MTSINLEEGIEFDRRGFEISEKRYRVLAFWIDFSIYVIIGYILGLFFGTNNGEGGFTLNGLPAFVMFLIGFFLWPISEGIWGQTIGKRLLDLKVVTNEFKPIGIRKAFIRFFFGFIDYSFLIGLIIAAINKQNKRIGDLVAETLVVKINSTTDNKI